MDFLNWTGLVLLLLSLFHESKAVDHETLLDRKLFPDGDRLHRPSPDKTSPVVVHFGVALRQIINVDEVNQVMITSMWVRMNWHNPFLAWNSSEFGGIDSINVRPKKMWVPDIVLLDSVDDVSPANLENRLDTNAIVDSSGAVTWLGPTIFKSQCSIEIEDFPFDFQNCTMEFASWTYDGTKLDLRLRQKNVVDLKNYVINGEWVLQNVSAHYRVARYDCCPEPFPSLTISVKLQRRTLFYLYNMIIPCILITFVAFISFFLPPDAGERIGLIITVLLSMAVFLLMVATSIPQTSESTPIISKFFVALMMEVGLALFTSCFLLRMHHKDGSVPMPRWLRCLMFGIFAKMVCYDVCSKGPHPKPPHGRQMPVQDDEKLLLESPKCDSCKKASPVSSDGRLLLENMTVIADRVKRKESDEEIKNEWKQACQIADRVMFIAFILLMMLTCLWIFKSAPYFYA